MVYGLEPKLVPSGQANIMVFFYRNTCRQTFNVITFCTELLLGGYYYINITRQE